MWVPLTLAALFAALVSHCFITVYEVEFNMFNSFRGEITSLNLYL